MRYLLLVALPLLLLAGCAAPGFALPLSQSLSPVALTPGQDQPITCSTGAQGSPADPVCPTATFTRTPTPPPTVTATPTASATPSPSPTFTPTLVPTPTPLQWTLAPGGQAIIYCPDGQPSTSLDTSDVAVACPTLTPTPGVTATPSGTAVASVYEITNPTSQTAFVQQTFSNGYTFESAIVAGSSQTVHVCDLTAIPRPFDGALTIRSNVPVTAVLTTPDPE